MTPRRTARVRSARRTLAPVLLTCAAFAVLRQARAAEFGPQGVVRQFCQADGLGERVNLAGRDAMAPLVAWALEPAWDHVVLIGSYEVGSPHGLDRGAVGVDVRYVVIGDLSAFGLDTAVHVETVEFRLEAIDGRWRIVGPPPPPHIFSHRADIESMRQSLERGGLNFLPNTVLLWTMFQSAGWNVPFVPTTDLLNGTAYRAVNEPRVGDVVVYLRDGVPYHAGVLEDRNLVVSSTLNAGIVRTATDAFPGEVRYLRLIQPPPAVEPTPVPSPGLTAVEPPPSPARIRRAPPRRTATPAVQPARRHRNKRRAQPSSSKRVKTQKGNKATKRPTPSATHHP